jgi:hypothetical protein
MDNQPKRSFWEQLRSHLFEPEASRAQDTAQPATTPPAGLPEPPPAEPAPLVVSAEIEALADRILEAMELGRHPQALTPEGQLQWEELKQPLKMMLDRYEISKVYLTWWRKPDNPNAHQAFQDALLGVLATDAELASGFAAALATGTPDTDETEPSSVNQSELTSDQPAKTSSLAPPAEPELPAPAIPPEALPEAPLPAELHTPAAEVQLRGINELTDELRSGGELYKIVYAMRYDNPSLHDLASKLANEPKLSSDLNDFFDQSNFGRQITGK